MDDVLAENGALLKQRHDLSEPSLVFVISWICLPKGMAMKVLEHRWIGQNVNTDHQKGGEASRNAKTIPLEFPT